MPSPTLFKILVPAMVFPTIGALLYFVWLPGSGVAQAVYGIEKLILAAAPIAFVVARWRHRPDRPRRHGRSLALGLASGIAIAAAAFGLMSTPLGDLVRQAAPAIVGKAETLGFADHFIVFAAFLSIFHSLIEELYWRWLVFGHLRERIRLPAAHALAAIAFSAHHLVILSVFFPFGLACFFTLAVAVGGVIWSVLYQSTGSLVGCWLSHALVDAALMAVAYPMIVAAT